MTSPKEAESEFSLAWYGYNESEGTASMGFQKSTF